jgi:hypothetical protein
VEPECLDMENPTRRWLNPSHPWLPRVRRRLQLALWLLPLSAAGCGDGTLIVLGDRAPPAYHFRPAQRISELSDPAKSDNPSLSVDLLEIYFTSERGGIPADIWRAERAKPDAPFGPPELASELNSARTETSPVLAADGLTLWLGSDRAGGQGDLDIWVSRRSARALPWSPPLNLSALNSAGKDIPRPPGERGRVMPLGSDRDTRNYYQIYFATRSGDSGSFEAPQLVEELSAASMSTVDAFLSDDGLLLLYVRGPAFGPADLFAAQRRSTGEPFAPGAPLDDLNTESDERDPWLSPDGRLLYFSSNRSGQYEIYVAERDGDATE